jgi:predicted Fe-S protein YdhL (DUF1289 family)
MSVASPCIGTCKLDEATGWCIGCARTGDEIANWGSRSDTARSQIWAALPERFAVLGVDCRRLPWTTQDIRHFVLNSLAGRAGQWSIGVEGAVAEFAARSGEPVETREDGHRIVAVTEGGALALRIDDNLRALTFDPPGTPPEQQRIVLASRRERGRLPVAQAVADLGPDRAAIRPADRGEILFDLGLGRKEARFCLRATSEGVREVLMAAVGSAPLLAGPHLQADLWRVGTVRVVESLLGRIEVTTPMPAPGEATPEGPRILLTGDHPATGRVLPAGMELPRAYLPVAAFHPTARDSGSLRRGRATEHPVPTVAG